jgi:hypothetical protein
LSLKGAICRQRPQKISAAILGYTPALLPGNPDLRVSLIYIGLTILTMQHHKHISSIDGLTVQYVVPL